MLSNKKEVDKWYCFLIFDEITNTSLNCFCDKILNSSLDEIKDKNLIYVELDNKKYVARVEQFLDEKKVIVANITTFNTSILENYFKTQTTLLQETLAKVVALENKVKYLQYSYDELSFETNPDFKPKTDKQTTSNQDFKFDENKKITKEDIKMVFESIKEKVNE